MELCVVSVLVEEGEGEEPLPVSEKIKVLRSQTLFKSGRWWAAVALFEAFGRRQVGLYLWFKRENGWRRRQKFVLRDRDEWDTVKKVVDGFIEEL